MYGALLAANGLEFSLYYIHNILKMSWRQLRLLLWYKETKKELFVSAL